MQFSIHDFQIITRFLKRRHDKNNNKKKTNHNELNAIVKCVHTFPSTYKRLVQIFTHYYM